MEDRLALLSFEDGAQLDQLVVRELKELTKSSPEYWSQTHLSLVACCAHVSGLGAIVAVVQRRVHDPDFLAEFSAYYSRQFAQISRNCVRIHFFSKAPTGDQGVLSFLDTPGLRDSYLGFMTLRPIARTPIGASILRPGPNAGFVRCLERFPVRIGGVSFEVTGTPFMQQDNAVGACAQASIWMALRTQKKREGDRSHDPAQITGAATRYAVSGRILPNRTGLTQAQIVEAIRAAGYSPHPITFSRGRVPFGLGSALNDEELSRARRVIHAYVESEIPVLLILYTAVSAHAVVVIGHTFDPEGEVRNELSLSLSRGAVKLTHAASWIPNFVVHNDNSGPYLRLESKAIKTGYALAQTYSAIPLLPSDVFVSGEEALEFGLATWSEMLEEFPESVSLQEISAISDRIAIRLLLLDKRKIRAWAARSAAPPEVKETLRMMDLPRRVWVCEFHQKTLYGRHAAQNVASLVGFVLLDSTADTSVSAMLMTFFDLPSFTDNTHGSLIVVAAGELTAIQTVAAGPIQPFRDLEDLNG